MEDDKRYRPIIGGNPLVTAERLHRFKCPFCGSKDKNISDANVVDDRKDSPTYQQWVPAVKYVVCNDCGYTMTFSHSAYAYGMVQANVAHELSMEESDKYVQESHMINHEDPKINPHTGEHPARNDYK